MPLNYSKWDRLEVSDDSDIEGHPNVDHRSLVGWKQRDIHEKRALRNRKIRELLSEIAINDVLLPRLRTITEEIHGAPDAPAQFSKLVEQLKTNPSTDAPPSDPKFDSGPQKKITYDEMILSLLLKVYGDAKEKGVEKNDERLRETLIGNLKGHVANLGERQEALKKELEQEEEEKNKKITSESIHEGWDSHYVPPKPEPKRLKGEKTEKRTDIELLNPKAVENAQIANLVSQTPPPTTTDSNVNDDDDDEIPEMTPTLEAFSRLPLKGYEESFHFIQEHRDVYVPGASDALLVQAFRAERAGDSTHAKKCVHQSLLLQYCEKLGPDGVGLFFKRMTSGDKRASSVFEKDVEDTFEHVRKRVKVAREEEETGGEEQIQLVPESAGQHISFIVPDGPPPEHLQLEGPGTEELDIEQVRKVLQMRWDVFNGFPEDLKEALKAQSLVKVNKVLGRMKVAEAEEVVGLLDSAGILNFADGGIRDQTGRGGQEGEDEGEEADMEDGDDEDAEKTKEA